LKAGRERPIGPFELVYVVFGFLLGLELVEVLAGFSQVEGGT
jgi:hypothetical protein